MVTGGCGFIGSHIVEKILEEGKEVIVFDDLSVGKKNNISHSTEFIQGDIKDTKALKGAMQDVDVVFHNAAFVSIRGSFEKIRKDIETNCLGTLNVLEAASDAGVKKLIFASSMAVYGEPKNLPVAENHPLKPVSPYGYSKMIGEHYCKIFEEQRGLKTLCLRYFNAYGIRQTPSDYVGVATIFINNVLTGKPMKIFGDGNQTRDFVWVKDIANANILAADSNVSNESINVASGSEISINQLAIVIKSNLGGTIKFAPRVPGEITRIVADINKAKKVLGFLPEGNFQKQLPGIIEWWKNEP